MFVWSDLENLGDLQLVIRDLVAGGIRDLSDTSRIPSNPLDAARPWAGGVKSFFYSQDGMFFR